MRRRNVKNVEVRIEAAKKNVIQSGKDYKGKWNELFGNDNPIYLEIGMGKVISLLNMQKLILILIISDLKNLLLS